MKWNKPAWRRKGTSERLEGGGMKDFKPEREFPP